MRKSRGSPVTCFIDLILRNCGGLKLTIVQPRSIGTPHLARAPERSSDVLRARVRAHIDEHFTGFGYRIRRVGEREAFDGTVFAYE